MEEYKSKVYIKIDEQGRILRCEGGYTMGNIRDISEWVLIDEGMGDRYNLCQSHYFDGGLHTRDGICRWKYEDGECVLRTDAEIEADRAARPAPAPTAEEQLRAQVTELNAMLAALLRGETEAGNADAE